MTLIDLPDGASVFIDANLIVYHFNGISTQCRTLFQRIERQEIRAATGAHIMLESLHRLMMIEAVAKGLITPGQPAQKLKRHPNVISQLRDYDRSAHEIRALGVRVFPVTLKQIRHSETMRAAYARRPSAASRGARSHSETMRAAYDLMANDSVTVAMMFNYGITNLASRDSDLGRVPGLTMYQPTDVP